MDVDEILNGGELLEVSVLDGGDIAMSDDELYRELKEIANEGRKDSENEKLPVEIITKETDKAKEKKVDEVNYKERYDNLRRRDVKDVKERDMFEDKLIDYHRLKKPLKVSKDTDRYVVGREIAYRLHEPKMKLFGNVVSVLGVDLSLEIFEETKKIVLKGGLKTDAGDRKRSPGGTFLYLMKSRGYASQKQMKQIFKFEYEGKKRAKQEKSKKQKIYSKYSKTQSNQDS